MFLVDDHPVLRAEVRSYLTSQGSVSVVGEACDAPEALRKARKLAPEVIVLDVNLPSQNGADSAALTDRELEVLTLLADGFSSKGVKRGPPDEDCQLDPRVGRLAV